MEEEHRKDREALARLKRFLSSNGNSQLSLPEMDDDPSDSSQYGHTIIGTIERVMQADPMRKWTVPTMLAHFRSEKFPLHAKTPEATLGVTLKKLVKRGKVRLVRQGAGRSPNVYRWKTEPKEVNQEGSERERATQGQPVHVH